MVTYFKYLRIILLILTFLFGLQLDIDNFSISLSMFSGWFYTYLDKILEFVALFLHKILNWIINYRMDHLNIFDTVEVKPVEDFHFDSEVEYDSIKYHEMLQEKDQYRSQLIDSFYTKTVDEPWYYNKKYWIIGGIAILCIGAITYWYFNHSNSPSDNASERGNIDLLNRIHESRWNDSNSDGGDITLNANEKAKLDPTDIVTQKHNSKNYFDSYQAEYDQYFSEPFDSDNTNVATSSKITLDKSMTDNPFDDLQKENKVIFDAETETFRPDDASSVNLSRSSSPSFNVNKYDAEDEEANFINWGKNLFKGKGKDKD